MVTSQARFASNYDPIAVDTRFCIAEVHQQIVTDVGTLECGRYLTRVSLDAQLLWLILPQGNLREISFAMGDGLVTIVEEQG